MPLTDPAFSAANLLFNTEIIVLPAERPTKKPLKNQEAAVSPAIKGSGCLKTGNPEHFIILPLCGSCPPSDE
jgi:hypothetical protein